MFGWGLVNALKLRLNPETHLAEMTIGSQSLVKLQLPHDGKARAVNKAEQVI